MNGTGLITFIGGSLLALIVAGMIAQKKLPPPKPKIVGIDLGTTYSCIGVYHAITGEVEVFEDDEHHKTFPSIVAVTEENILVGHNALLQMKKNSKYTYYDAKRFVGRKFCALEPEDVEGRYPFEVKNVDGRPVFTLPKSCPIEEDFMSPEMVGAEILKKMVELAESKLKSKISKAVISVPAKFSESQRNATRKAAEIAGLEVMRIIQEPTAAAMAYGLHKRSNPSMILVVDLGGGTLDVSLLGVHGGMFLTLSTAGNNRMGGQDFNERLLNFVQENIAKSCGCHVTNPAALQELHTKVEYAKLALTDNTSTVIDLSNQTYAQEGVCNCKELVSLNITRKTFEKLNADLFERVLEPIETVLKSSETAKEEIDEIVLVGGSTRVPKIRQIISEYFGGKKLNHEVDPDLAVVHGCATQGGIISGMWPLKVAAAEIPFETAPTTDKC
jgi:stress 70 chaperone-associated protein